MLSFFAKTAVTFAIPKLVAQVPKLLENTYDYFFGEDTKEVKVIETLKPPRKRSDKTRFTQCQFDFIQDAYKQWFIFNQDNPSRKKSRADLVDVLNYQLGMNKGITSFSNIWNNKIDRDTLAKGVPVLTKETK